MAGGKPPPPPLSPHEEGEITNIKPFFPKHYRHPQKLDSRMVTISSNFPSSSIGNISSLPSSDKPTYSEVVKGPPTLRPTVNNLDVSQPMNSDATLRPISRYQGKPSVIFPISEKKQLVDKLQFVLIGKFTHGRPSWATIMHFFENLKLSGPHSISIYDKKHIFIECSNNFDYYRIWMKLTWFIGDYAMRVFKWTANFSPLVEAAIAPVWVRFEGLPLYMFDELPLLSVSNCIGKPIRVDPRNVSRTIVNSARVCVELDISQPLVEDVWVNFEDEQTKELLEGFWVKVFYDVVPPYCDFCSHIGHGMQICKRRADMVILGDKRLERTEEPVCTPDVNVELVRTNKGFAGQGDAGRVWADNALCEVHVSAAAGTSHEERDVAELNQDTPVGASGAYKLGAAHKDAAFIGHEVGELGGINKGIKQVEGMLANKALLCGTFITSSKTSVKPNFVKQRQRHNKTYQVKKQTIPPSESLEVSKNSFAILEEDVLIEDLTLEEGEFVVAEVFEAAGDGNHVNVPINSVKVAADVGAHGQAAAAVLSSHADSAAAGDGHESLDAPVSAKSTLSATNVVSPNAVEIVQSVAGEIGHGRAIARELSKGVDAGFQELADGKVEADLKAPARDSGTSGKATAAGEGSAECGVDNSATSQIPGAAVSTKQAAGAVAVRSKTQLAAGYHGAGKSKVTGEPAPRVLSASAVEFCPGIVANKNTETPGVLLQRHKLAEQHGSQVTRYGSPYLSDEMGDIICAFKCKSVPNSPSRSRKQSKSIYDSPVYSPATIALCKKYGSDTSDDFDGSWEDYD